MKKLLFVFLFIPLLGFSQNLKFLEKITAPIGYKIACGQISKSGNEYYLPAINDSGECKFFVYKIKNNGNYKLDKTIIIYDENKEGVFPRQISITNDYHSFVFAWSKKKKDTLNDLYICYWDDYYKHFSKKKFLGGINEYKNNESYPWISPEGLRIYYVLKTKIFFSFKSSKDRYFKYPEPLKINLKNIKVKSFWLTNDELNIYIISSKNIIYKSTRNNKNKAFSKPEIFLNSNPASINISSFCLNNKGNIALIYSCDKSKENGMISIYEIIED
ncbi:MAG: hypothetical protein U9R42_12410 [Bacteroidota bacterium]|nr:hypothetical protein [Bacteroidota bacterium]